MVEDGWSFCKWKKEKCLELLKHCYCQKLMDSIAIEGSKKKRLMCENKASNFFKKVTLILLLLSPKVVKKERERERERVMYVSDGYSEVTGHNLNIKITTRLQIQEHENE